MLGLLLIQYLQFRMSKNQLRGQEQMWPPLSQLQLVESC